MKNSAFSFVACIICFLYTLVILDYLLITSIGLAFSLYIALDFVNKLGQDYPLKQLIILLSAVQWVVGAKVSYAYGDIHYKYYMYVEEESYMTLVVPSLIAMYVGLSLFKVPNLKAKLDNLVSNLDFDRSQAKRTANILLFFGVCGAVFGRVLHIPSLAFVFYIINLLIYISVGYYFYAYPRKKTLIFILFITLFFWEALLSGMFHNFLLVGVFLYLIYAKRETPFLKKMTIILLAVVFVNAIQIIKKDYRLIIWNNQTNNTEVFLELLEQRFFENSAEEGVFNYGHNRKDENEDVATVTTRINQGWIISKVLDNIPKNQDFLDGESVAGAISASLLPRFLFPNKTSGNDAKKIYEKATGLKLFDNTAMGLSLAGEFYANFGVHGTWISCLLYGSFISLFLKMLVGYTNESPFILFWFVLIFFQVIKAESNLLSILNHLTKSIVFTYLFKHVLASLLNVQLFYNSKIR